MTISFSTPNPSSRASLASGLTTLPQDVGTRASTSPSDEDHLLGGRHRPITGGAHGESSMTGDDELDIGSTLSQFERIKDLSMSMDPAHLLGVAKLLARMEELLLASRESREMVLRVGPLQFDLLTRTVRRGERMIDLRPRELRLLQYMMRREGQVLTRAMLFEEVWSYKFIPSSNLVDVHMGRLRRRIDEPQQSPMIYCVRGQGFVLRAPD